MKPRDRLGWMLLLITTVTSQDSRHKVPQGPGRFPIPMDLDAVLESKNRLDRTTTSIPRVQLQEWIAANPELKKLAMFGGATNTVVDDSTDAPGGETPRAEDDNFHWQYTEVNRTLFAQTDRPDEETLTQIAMASPRRRMPTTDEGKRDRGDHAKWKSRHSHDTVLPAATTTQEPFVVTPSLLNDLASLGKAVEDIDVKRTFVSITPSLPVAIEMGVTRMLLTPSTTPTPPPPMRVPEFAPTRTHGIHSGMRKKAHGRPLEQESDLVEQSIELNSEEDENVNDSEGGGGGGGGGEGEEGEEKRGEENTGATSETPFLADSSTFEIPTTRPSTLPAVSEWLHPSTTTTATSRFVDISKNAGMDQSTLNYFSEHKHYFPQGEAWEPSKRDELVLFNDDQRNTESSQLEPLIHRIPPSLPPRMLAEMFPTPLSPVQFRGTRKHLKQKLIKIKRTRGTTTTTTTTPSPPDRVEAYRNPGGRGRMMYRVSGTKRHEDNGSYRTGRRHHFEHTKKIPYPSEMNTSGGFRDYDLDIPKSPKRQPVSHSWGRMGELAVMQEDRRFAMEHEIRRTKKLADELRRSAAPLKKNLYSFHRKYGRTATHAGSIAAPLSKAHMVSRGGRPVEQRVTLIGGQMVTVDLSNPNLHGADLMASPGAIIHDDLRSMRASKKWRHHRDGQTEISGGRVENEVEEMDLFPLSMPSRLRSSRFRGTDEWRHNNIEDDKFDFPSNNRIFQDGRLASQFKVETFDASHLAQSVDGGEYYDEEATTPSSENISSQERHRAPSNVRRNGIGIARDEHKASVPNSSSAGLYSQVNEKPLVPRDTAEDRAIIHACFAERANSYLIDASPMERRIGLGPMECLRFCSSIPGCLSVSYASTLAICDIFNTRNGADSASLVKLLGYTYYEPKVTNVVECIDASAFPSPSPRSRSPKRPKRIGGVKQQEIESSNLLDAVNAGATLVNSADPAMAAIMKRRAGRNLTLATRARCEVGEEVLFVRSSGIRNEAGRNLDTVLNINEDDCVFSCISNLAGYYDAFDCVSAQYDAFNEACTLSTDPPMDHQLSLHTLTNFYEKICIHAPSGTRCSGGNVDRRRQRVTVGLQRDAVTATDPVQCLERCIDTDGKLEFRCMSVLYYYEESERNCVLNDGSAQTHPEALKDEAERIVDYFGIDECHGIREIRHVANGEKNELRNYVHEGDVKHRIVSRTGRSLKPYEQARIRRRKLKRI